MKFFCMDVHISVIEDFKKVCPHIQVVDWCMSGHSWVLNRQQDRPLIINASTWRNIDLDMIANFQRRYDGFLQQFDGFIVGYASCFAMVYEKYNKPIILLNAVRYDVPFCWSRNQRMLVDYHICLHKLNASRRLIAVSNNKADQLYLQKGAGISSLYIPSLCDYTRVHYSPSKSTFLCYHGSTPEHPLVTQKAQLPHPHSWNDITTYRGIISFPYEISLMSLFEQFTMGMPMFFPSKTYWKENPGIQSISAYWQNLPSSFEELRDLNTWIDLSDVYDTFQSPNTYYFDSIPHLFALLDSFVYVDDRLQREERASSIRSTWKQHLLTYNIA